MAIPSGGAATPSSAAVVSRILVPFLLVLTSCSDPGGPPTPVLPVDEAGPSVRVVAAVDGDEDGLLDLRIEWFDSSGIDLESAQVLSIRGVHGTAHGNLLGHWTMTRLDSTGLVVEETIAQLLPPGANTLVLRISDRLGNVTVDSVDVVLPPSARHRTLESGGTGIPGGAVLCEDGLIYMVNSFSMFIVDPELLSLQVVLHPSNRDYLMSPLCVPGDPYVYAATRGDQFSRAERQWVGYGMENFTGVTELAASRRNPAIYYAAAMRSGRVAVIDRATNRWINWLLAEASAWADEWVPTMVVMPNDEKVYVGRQQEGGLLVVDGQTGGVLTRIKLAHAVYPYDGTPGTATLSGDSREIFMSYPSYVDPSILRIDTQTDRVSWRLRLTEGLPGDLALSPDGRRLFVSTSNLQPGVASKNVLIDVDDWSVIATFERPQVDGEVRIDGGVVFRQDGKLIFCGEGGNVGVYLNRL